MADTGPSINRRARRVVRYQFQIASASQMWCQRSAWRAKNFAVARNDPQRSGKLIMIPKDKLGCDMRWWCLSRELRSPKNDGELGYGRKPLNFSHYGSPRPTVESLSSSDDQLYSSIWNIRPASRGNNLRIERVPFWFHSFFLHAMSGVCRFRVPEMNQDSRHSISQEKCSV
jgi:hypothetical protein